MFDSERNIYLQETEIKPNKNASLTLVFLFFGMLFCWGLNEIGLFRVGVWEMRIGSAIPLFINLVMLMSLVIFPKLLEKPITKYLIFIVAAIYTVFMGTLLTFHTTMMLLFPIFLAMLYRSERLGVLACICSILCTVVTPVLGYVLHLWDIPLFQELILIGTNVNVEIVGATNEITLLSIGKIILYLSLPRLVMVGSCSLLMFYVIRMSTRHIENQILLDRINRKDALTGLYNQNYFKQILKTEHHGRIGLIFFDVNGLKLANDSRGHEYGDVLLRRCAKSLTDVCDESTVGFRVGGDEFLLLMPDATDETVDAKLTQWKEALEQINRENMVEYDGLRCSLAYGCVTGDLSELSDLMRKADEIMYENKVRMKAQQQ